MNCLFCNKEVEQKEGKRRREFCNGNCRNKHYYKKNNEGKPKKKVGRPPVFKSVPKKEKERLDSKIEYKAPTPESYDGKKLEGITYDEHPQFMVTKPKNLDELKAMCPPELKGFERSEWIANKRQEYGI